MILSVKLVVSDNMNSLESCSYKKKKEKQKITNKTLTLLYLATLVDPAPWEVALFQKLSADTYNYQWTLAAIGRYL